MENGSAINVHSVKQSVIMAEDWKGMEPGTHPHYCLHVQCTWPHTKGSCVGKEEPILEQATKRTPPHILV